MFAWWFPEVTMSLCVDLRNVVKGAADPDPGFLLQTFVLTIAKIGRWPIFLP
jgi:hypothetical protein